MKFTELKAALASGHRAVYILTGDDHFVIGLASKRLKGLVTGLPELNFTSFGNDAPPDEIVAACEAFPIMSDLRVIEVADYARDTARLSEYAAAPCPSTVLYLIAPNFGKNLTPLLARAEVVDCSRLDEKYLLTWISKRAKAENGKISAEAASLLISYCNRCLSRVDSELDKLLSYRSGEMIGEEDVRVLVTPDLEFKIYELGDAVALRDGARAMTILENLLTYTQVSSLLGMIYSHFRRLLYVSVSGTREGVAADLGVKEYAVKMAAKQAALFSPLKLKKIVDWLSAFDREYKAGLIPDRIGLEKTVLQILNV